MKISQCRFLPLAFCGIAVIGLASTGCEKALKLQAESQQTRARFDALNTESSALEAKLIELRKALPPGPAPEESARQLQARSSGELTILEANLKAAAANLKEMEIEVANLKKSIDSQQPKAK